MVVSIFADMIDVVYNHHDILEGKRKIEAKFH